MRSTNYTTHPLSTWARPWAFWALLISAGSAMAAAPPDEFIQGFELYARGHYAYAEQTFRKGLEKAPNDPLGSCYLADILQKKPLRSEAQARELAALWQACQHAPAEFAPELVRQSNEKAQLAIRQIERLKVDTAEEALNKGLYFYNKNDSVSDSANAYIYFLDAANKGSAKAMFYLGARYDFGRGVTKNDIEAVRWYGKAAEAGNASAMNNLGLMYLDGRGVTKDEAQAVRWYRKGAEAGNADAMANLGFMYQVGRGVTKDEAQAVHWYSKGAEAGHAGAMNNLGVMYKYGRGVPKDETAALRWIQKAADIGNSTAMYILGSYYQNGVAVAKDETEAIRWYRKAAAAGQEDAQKALQRLGQP